MTAGGEEVFFKIKQTTKLSKLQGAYANKVGKDVGSIRSVFSFLLSSSLCVCGRESFFFFYGWGSSKLLDILWDFWYDNLRAFRPCLTCRFLYDGSRINDDDTPASLDMEDNGASKGSLFHVRSSTYHVLPQCPPPHNRHYWCHGRAWVIQLSNLSLTKKGSRHLIYLYLL